MEKTNVNKDTNRNDWDLSDDDNWDDWGDAEDGEMATVSASQQAKQQVEQNSENALEKNNLNRPKESMKFSNMENNNTVPKVSKQATKCNSGEDMGAAAAGGGGWGSLFGGVVSSVFSTATELTSTVTQGLDKVIGVPDPEEMARINAFQEALIKEQQLNSCDKVEENDQNDDRSLTPTKAGQPAFSMNLMNNVTSLGSKVLNTGLDTLEGIGKKTMHILQDNDPLLKNRIKNFGIEKEKPNLVEILKEAKKETEEMEKSMRVLNIEKLRAQLRFEFLFENYCGLVHLEALEILSKESDLKLKILKETVSGKASEEMQETLNEVKELMELEDFECDPESEDYTADELNDKLSQAIEDAELSIGFSEIKDLWSATLDWLQSEESRDPETQEIFAKAVKTLAETCALEILKLHKIAELLLIKDHHSTANEVDGIVQLSKQFNMHLQVVANRFASCLNNHPQQEDAKSHISTIFSEMLQARQQIEKSFHLFLPILQIGAV